MAKRSRRYQQLSAKLAERGDQPLPIKDALKLLKSFASGSFDESVEVALNLGVDPKHADQIVRGAVVLPKGIGKTVCVAVFAEGDDAAKAEAAGADIVGSDDLVKRIKDGFLGFDVAIAVPSMTRKVGPLGRTLGPKGLMPSPKSGTVSADVDSAVKEFKAGTVEYRTDATGQLHARVGKLSFPEADLEANVRAFTEHIRIRRPAAVKGTFIKGATISATMSPGVPIAVA